MEFNATFLVSAISFIVFTILMNKILYAPLEKIVEERENFISGNYSDAKNAEEKAGSILQEVADKIASARSEARVLQAKRLKSENDLASEMVKEAKSEMNKFVSAQKDLINKKVASTDVDVKELADLITDKLLERGGNNG